MPPAEHVATLPRVALVGCSKQKLDHAAPARELYQGALFKLAREYAEACCDSWMILSARHGLVDPDRVLEPYNRALQDMNHAQRKVWGGQVGSAIARQYDYFSYLGSPKATFVALAPATYMDALADGMGRAWRATTFPLRGLGIGQQKHWLIDATRSVRRASR